MTSRVPLKLVARVRTAKNAKLFRQEPVQPLDLPEQPQRLLVAHRHGDHVI